MLDRFIRLLENINEIIGRCLAWLTLGIVLVTFAVVVLRYMFDLGWIALQESVNYMHATVFMLGAAYAFKNNAHVRVDIFYSRLNARGKAWVNMLGNLLFLLPVCVFIFLASFDYVQISWKIKEASLETGGLPFVFLLKTTIPLMALLLLIQAIANSLKQLIIILAPSSPQHRATE